MKVVIFAGGRGRRLAERTDRIPKPLVPIGGRPILWHVMQIYARQGFDEFLLALGYGAERIERWWQERAPELPWRVTAVDTGLDTPKAERLRRLRDQLGETFLLTYADGLSDVDLGALLAFHRAHGRAVTLSAVHPPARFGRVTLEGPRVARFREKAAAEEGWINGGFFVIEPRVFEEIREGEELEADVLTRLAERGELGAYRHEGFWQCMDTLHEQRRLEALWAGGAAPWASAPSRPGAPA